MDKHLWLISLGKLTYIYLNNHVISIAIQLEHLERLRIPPVASWLPTLLSHIGSQVKITNLNNLPKFQIVEFLNKHYTWHIFWSCVIRFANIKWIWQVLLKIQSRHDSVHRRTDGQGETSIPPFQLRWSGGYDKDPHTHPPNPQIPTQKKNPKQAIMFSKIYHRTLGRWDGQWQMLTISQPWSTATINLSQHLGPGKTRQQE